MTPPALRGAQDPDAPAAVPGHRKDVCLRAIEQVSGDEVQRQDPLRLGPQELRPARAVPAPRRDGPGWAEFLRSQAQGILALDFFTADLLNGTKAYVLAVTGHGSRRVRVLGATGHPAWSWALQQARNLLMDLGDAGTRAKFVLNDRDASFTQASGAVFQAAQDPGHPLRRSGTANEFDHGAVDWQLPA